MIGRNAAFAVSVMLLVAGCNSEPKAEPKAKAQTTASIDKPVAAIAPQIGTPMAERIAVIGLLNKRNGQTRDFELKPGEAMRFGKVVLRLRACEKTAPWENYQDQGAFVQLIVRQRPPGTNDAERWAQVFSGWLFKENPAVNVVQHPIYDVWVKECKMNFPGEEALDESADEPAAPSNPSSAAQSPRPDEKAAAEPATDALSDDGEAVEET